MSTIPSFQTQSGFGNVPTGFSGLTYLDPVEIDVLGNGYAAEVTDYAAVSAANTTIVAETVLGTNAPAQVSHRLQTLQRTKSVDANGNGDLFSYNPHSGGNGLGVGRSNSAGVSQNSIAISTASAVMSDPGFDFLSNGDIVVAYTDGANSDNVTFEILDANLNQVVAPTTNSEAPSSTTLKAVQVKAIPSGGFAMLYVKASTNQVRLDIRDNSGAPVGASPFTILGLTGTAGTVMPRLAIDSDGNLVIIFQSAYTVTVGTYFAIMTPAGVSVVGATNVDVSPTITGVIPPFTEVSTLPGFFAFGRASAANIKVWVYANGSSSQQGSTFTIATTAYGSFSSGTFNVTNDGTRFWLMNWISNADGFFHGTPITTGGIAGTTIPIVAGGGNAGAIDIKLDRGNRFVMVVTNPVGLTKVQYAVFNPVTLQVEVPLTAFGSTAASAAGGLESCLPVGDFAFLANYNVDNEHQYIVIKHTATAFVGQGQKASANPAAGPTPVRTAANIYPCNAMIGSPSKTFDHSAATPHGNKGTLSLNALSLEGY